MTKIFRKQYKQPHKCNNEHFVSSYFKIHAVKIAKFCSTCKKHVGGNRSLSSDHFAWPNYNMQSESCFDRALFATL